MGRSRSDTAHEGHCGPGSTWSPHLLTMSNQQPSTGEKCCPERASLPGRDGDCGGAAVPSNTPLIINGGNLNHLSWRNTKLKWHACIGLWVRRFLATSHIRFSSPLLFKSNQCAFIPAHISISLWQSAKFLTSAMSELWYFLPLVDLVNIFFITLISFFITLHYNIHILQDTWVLQQAPVALCGYTIAYKH